jgi:hypothetical protein
MFNISVPKGGTSPLFIMSSMCPTMLKLSSLEEEVMPKKTLTKVIPMKFILTIQ